jgi:hypothetical protein
MRTTHNLAKNFFDSQQVPYKHHAHSTAFTAQQQLASAENVPGAISSLWPCCPPAHASM